MPDPADNKLSSKGSIRYYGELFKGNNLTPAIRESLEEAREYGQLAIRARTPVDTGNLKGQWRAYLEGNGLRFTNAAPYALYVEMGTKRMRARPMLANSLPEIQDVFNKALARNIGRKLSARITAPSVGFPSYEQYKGAKPERPAQAQGLLARLANGLRGIR